MKAPPTFGEFFAALWAGQTAFPWQQRLARQVCSGSWPNTIALPTACGKTSVIDTWVWALAMGALGTAPRQPRRLFFVIDRRIVVDEVHSRAATIAARLSEAREADDPVGQIARALLALGGEEPLRAARLRGGLEIDPNWAQNPVQPLVCASTVDQVGSRLLFRGYGLARGLRNPLSIHAALVGADALIVLDEAHLSTPFEETLGMVNRLRAAPSGGVDLPWEVVRMTATPRGDEVAFSLTDEDLSDERLSRRVRAPKRARLVALPKKGAEDPVATACAAEVEAMLADASGPRAIGVVVNRVARARRIAEAIRGRHTGAEVVVLIGPSRPVERDAALRRTWERLKAGRDRRPDDGRLVLVATQCIEVGADIDLDALVTECASVDALRQRFGRLDRLGELSGSARAVIVESPTSQPDPVYGEALAQTWKWLGAIADKEQMVDFSVERLPAAPPETRSPERRAPVLFPAYIDRLSQTSPLPAGDPAVGEFLHGQDSDSADVEIVWRADLPSESSRWADTVAMTPPSGREAVRVSMAAARQWLLGTDLEDVSDMEGEARVRADRAGEDAGPATAIALRWRGPQDIDTRPVARRGGLGVVAVAALRPGDTIVVPATRGGCDEDGWAPHSRKPVVDVADRVAFEAGRPTLRLHPGAWATRDHGLPLGLHRGLLRPSDDDGATLEPDRGAIAETLRTIAASGSALRDLATALLAVEDRLDVVAYPSAGAVRIGDEGVLLAVAEPDPSDDEDRLAGAQGEVLLADHQRAVADQAARWGAALGLEPALVESLGAAGQIHDAGKVDPRFQTLLRQGAAPLEGAPPLAKSRIGRRDRQARRAALRASGLPTGYRHEATSLVLHEGRAPSGTTADPDLVGHLVASHHGCARPYLPAIPDPGSWMDTSEFSRVDGIVPERFWTLSRRLGWWGLALLEAVLRLADHEVSAAEERSR